MHYYIVILTQVQCITETNPTRPLSRCYLRLYLVKNTAGSHKEPNKKYKNNLQTLKSKRTAGQLDYRFSRSDQSFERVQNHTSFHAFYWDVTICQDMFYDLKRSFLI